MSTDEDGDGNGDGDFVTYVAFNQFKENNAVLCKEYRSHVETKIGSVEKTIVGKIKMVGTVMGFIVTFLTLINVYLSVIM